MSSSPVAGFIGFLDDDAEFGDELGFGTSTTCRSVVRSNGSAAAYKLVSNRPRNRAVRQSPNQLHHTQRKSLRPILQFLLTHRDAPNRKSKLKNHHF